MAKSSTFWACAVLSLAACTGAIEEAGSTGTGPAGGGPNVTPAGDPSQPPPAGSCKTPRPAARRIWRLNDAQYANAVRDLFPGVSVPAVATAGRSTREFVSLADALPFDGQTVALVNQAARSVGDQVAGNSATYAKCASGADPRKCAQGFIESFAARAFRRPLGAADTDGLLAVYDAGSAGGFAAGIGMVVEAVLQSADFLYRTELGPPPGSAAEVILTPHEVASALSFFLLDSIPDEALWAAVSDGSLADPAVLARQLDRLFALPRVKQNLTSVMATWLGAPRVLTTEKTSTGFDANLRASMLEETRRFLEATLWSGGTVGDLYSSRKAFVDKRMASFLGTAAPRTDWGAVTLDPGRWSGALTRPALVAGFPEQNRSVHRGLFIRKRILCGTLPPPPPGVDTNANVRPDMTERQRVAVRASQSCAGCHGLMDPLGLSLEHYDTVGRYVFSRDARPVDASGTLVGVDVAGPFEDMIDLSARFAGSADVTRCLVDQIASYAVGRTLDDDERCSDGALVAKAGPASLRLSDVFREIASSPMLRVRSAGEAK